MFIVNEKLSLLLTSLIGHAKGSQPPASSFVMGYTMTKSLLFVAVFALHTNATVVISLGILIKIGATKDNNSDVSCS